MRWLPLALLLLAAPAEGALTLTATAPVLPVPLNDSVQVVVAVTIDCADLPPRADDLEVRLGLSAPGLTLTGPDHLTIDPTDCSGTELTWRGEAGYTVNGSRYLAGLVPIPGNATAAVAPPPHPLLDVAPATARFNVTPEPYVDAGFRELLAPTQATNGTVALDGRMVSLSNVDLVVGMQWTGAPSTSSDGGRETQIPLPRGVLTLPDGVRLPRASLDGTPGTVALNITWNGEAGHSGTDRFLLVATGAVPGRPDLEIRAEALLVVPYDLSPAAGGGTGRAGGALSPVTSATPGNSEGTPGPGAAAALLALGAAGLLAAGRGRRGRPSL